MDLDTKSVVNQILALLNLHGDSNKRSTLAIWTFSVLRASVQDFGTRNRLVITDSQQRTLLSATKSGTIVPIEVFFSVGWASVTDQRLIDVVDLLGQFDLSQQSIRGHRVSPLDSLQTRMWNLISANPGRVGFLNVLCVIVERGVVNAY